MMISACASTTSREIYDAEGNVVHDIKCKVFALPDNPIAKNNCLKKAGDLCGEKGYKTIEGPSGKYNVVTMVVQCK